MRRFTVNPGLDPSAGVSAWSAWEALRLQVNTFSVQLALATVAEDDSTAFQAIEAARAALGEMRKGLPRLRQAIKNYDPDMAAELCVVASPEALDGFAEKLTEQMRRFGVVGVA